MSLSDQLQDIIHAPGVAPLAFVLAFAAGASHAVMPGHGKSLAAAYLVGARGRLRDAAWLGVSVATMHTISVLAIGLAWTFLSLANIIHMETLTTGLQLAAGLLVVGTGIYLVHRHIRAASYPHDHHHPHTHPHEHPHAHEHKHPHDHDHDTEKRPGLLLLGISGGLTPSPAAFLVLVTGLFIGRAGFALLLVLTFGIGMAVVLFGVGLLAVAGSTVVVRGSQSRTVLRLASRVAPILAAVSITALGTGITALAAIHLANS